MPDEVQSKKEVATLLKIGGQRRIVCTERGDRRKLRARSRPTQKRQARRTAPRPMVGSR